MKLRIKVTTLVVGLALFGTPALCLAGGPRCPAGYELHYDGYWDADFCSPVGVNLDYEDRGAVDVSDYWAAVFVNTADGSLHGVKDFQSDGGAQKAASKICKQDLKAKKIKGKCEYVTSWGNDFGAFVAGDDGIIHFDYGSNMVTATATAMDGCRAKTQNCKVLLQVDSEGY